MFSLADWDANVLDEPHTNMPPEFMGSGEAWGDEAYQFEAHSLDISDLQRSMKTDIVQFVEEEMNTRVNNWDEYYIALQRLALRVERVAITAGANMASNNDLLASTTWRTREGKNGESAREPNTGNKRSKLYYLAHLRSCEFSRGVTAHIKNCKSLFRTAAIEKCILAIAPELNILLNRLWWIANLTISVSKNAFP